MSMEEKGNQNLGTPTFCRNGCGFYAAQAFDGMCSKCYKDLKQQLQQPDDSATQAVDDVDAMAAALGRTSLTEMNVNASSSNNGTSPSSSNDNLLPTTSTGPAAASSSSTGAVGDTPPSAGQLDTASPTVPSVKGASTASTSTAKSEDDPTSSASPDGEGADDDKGKKPKKNRCMECRKKVGLTGFQCHCGKLFCSLHRYSDTHECTFDFKEKGQEEIRKNNPVIKGEKIQKI